MQEIKFRAWDKKKKKMMKVGTIHLFPDQYTFEIERRGFKYIKQPNEIILMQYTGLKDKRNCEIFEGDILKMNPDDDEWYDFVVWWNEQSMFELNSFANFDIKGVAKRLFKNDSLVRQGYQTAEQMAISNRNCTMVRLADCVLGDENPSIIIGNTLENPKLLGKGECAKI